MRWFGVRKSITWNWVVIVLISFVGISGCDNKKSTPQDDPPDVPDVREEEPYVREDVSPIEGVHSVARLWNEVLLDAIRNDYARPTVHARNLFHISAAMYDSWAAFDSGVSTYILGRRYGSVDCQADLTSFLGQTETLKEDREASISYAAYRLIEHRFQGSPGMENTMSAAATLMQMLGYDITNRDQNVASGNASALGNFIAQCYIQFGLQDGANEANGYSNRYYTTSNPPLAPLLPGNPDIDDLDRWQPLALFTFIDQAGNPISGGALSFLSPEWGNVEPFALSDNELSVYEREGNIYKVFYDPGPPPSAGEESYQWGFGLVSAWSSHLDPADEVMWDISPAAIGNIQNLPSSTEEYPAFYRLDGGDTSPGHAVNPTTGEAYAEQWVPRGDYTRVLAEFWADGPDSETPPGHWFVILNSVVDHPLFVRQFSGMGEELDPLEWDVKSYFTLGGAMHDSAIAAWSIKGWYDYIRPISALRAMADLGQSSDPNLPSYHPQGVRLEPGFIELVQPGEPLAGYEDQFVGKIKVRSWQGPDFVVNPLTDIGEVGWILAEDWWPYQRPSFVTPPFAGYVSGHSTYSRAAAEVLTRLTGDAFFPGGKSGFTIKANEFLVFEQGPSVDMTLEWATYRDASDQCSLSRIWGGIHPPADDIPGRKIGESIGIKAFGRAEEYFTGSR